MKLLGDDKNHIERVDQCVFSFALQAYYTGARIMWVDQSIYNGELLTLYRHHSYDEYPPFDEDFMIRPYFFDKPLERVFRPEDITQQTIDHA